MSEPFRQSSEAAPSTAANYRFFEHPYRRFKPHACGFFGGKLLHGDYIRALDKRQVLLYGVP
jgi:hypothetical protein